MGWEVPPRTLYNVSRFAIVENYPIAALLLGAALFADSGV
jgi:hypothetical protein